MVNAYILAPGRPLAELLPALAATVETWSGALAGVGLLDGGAGIAVRGLTAAVRFLSGLDADEE